MDKQATYEINAELTVNNFYAENLCCFFPNLAVSVMLTNETISCG